MKQAAGVLGRSYCSWAQARWAATEVNEAQVIQGPVTNTSLS